LVLSVLVANQKLLLQNPKKISQTAVSPCSGLYWLNLLAFTAGPQRDVFYFVLFVLRSRIDRGAINDYQIVVDRSAIYTRDDLCPPFTHQFVLLTAASRFDAKLVVLPGRSGAA